jgi:hypothetical protein
MPNRILRVRDIWQANGDVVLEFEGLSPEGARYIRVMLFKRLISPESGYDLPELANRLREYAEELRRKLSLCEMLVKVVPPGREHREP